MRWSPQQQQHKTWRRAKMCVRGGAAAIFENGKNEISLLTAVMGSMHFKSCLDRRNSVIIQQVIMTCQLSYFLLFLSQSSPTKLFFKAFSEKVLKRPSFEVECRLLLAIKVDGRSRREFRRLLFFFWVGIATARLRLIAATIISWTPDLKHKFYIFYVFFVVVSSINSLSHDVFI